MSLLILIYLLINIFQELQFALKVLNFFFTSIFILEALARMISLGLVRYLVDGWVQSSWVRRGDPSRFVTLPKAFVEQKTKTLNLTTVHG